MFRKPFNVKSNINMRNSEKRKLLEKVTRSFGISDFEDYKAQVAVVRLQTATGLDVIVYNFDKVPFIFETADRRLYPTVYFLWKNQNVLPLLFINKSVLGVLERGADLMLPGILRLPQIPFPDFPSNAPIAISVTDFSGKLTGPMAVGRTLMSSIEMTASGMRGKGVEILHLYRDHLWEFGPRGSPNSDTVSTTGLSALNINDSEQFPDLGAEPVQEIETGDKLDNLVNAVVADAELVQQDTDQQEFAQCAECDEPSEQLLYRCFLAALKHRLTKATQLLPLDVGEFYSRYLLPSVPQGKRLDMKKTKYKKFAVFLREVGPHNIKSQSDESDTAISSSSDNSWLVRITTKAKGCDMISEVNWNHSDLKQFELSDERVSNWQEKEANSEETAIGSICAPTIAAGFSVTEPVCRLFNCVDSTVSKGDWFSIERIREIVTFFVKSRELSDGKTVRLADPILSSVVKTDEERISWNDLIQKVSARMTPTYRLKFADGRVIVKKGALPKITFKIETRSGNKRVTLINNLSVYGIEPKEFAKKVQSAVAGSASVQQEAVGSEGAQVLIQGNHVAYVGKLLIDGFHLDKRFIAGLELAPKTKKAKN